MIRPTPTTPDEVADYLDPFGAGTPCRADVAHTHSRTVTALGVDEGRIVWRLGQQLHWERSYQRSLARTVPGRVA